MKYNKKFYDCTINEFFRDAFKDAPTTCIIKGTAGPQYELSDKAIDFSDCLQLKDRSANMADGHSGKVDVIEIEGKRVCVVHGRLHYYQGYSIEEVVMLPRMLALWGCKKFIITNASGSLQSDYKVGQIVNVTDQVLDGSIPNPMIGADIIKNDNGEPLFGTGFTSMEDACGLAPLVNKIMLETQHEDLRKRIKVSGRYTATCGPTFESLSESIKFKQYSDIVGMSSVPELYALRCMGLTDLAILSLITNVTPVLRKEGVQVNHDDNLKEAIKAQPAFTALTNETVKQAA